MISDWPPGNGESCIASRRPDRPRISKEVIAELAELSDRYNNAFDPTSVDAVQAEDQFNARLYSLHAIHGADVDFRSFRYELIAQCRKYLANN